MALSHHRVDRGPIGADAQLVGTFHETGTAGLESRAIWTGRNRKSMQRLQPPSRVRVESLADN
jgi:hypothetical protein